VEERGAQLVADGVTPADMVAQAVDGLPVGDAFPELQHGDSQEQGGIDGGTTVVRTIGFGQGWASPNEQGHHGAGEEPVAVLIVQYEGGAREEELVLGAKAGSHHGRVAWEPGGLGAAGRGDWRAHGPKDRLHRSYS
jgi:hypothetical protein